MMDALEERLRGLGTVVTVLDETDLRRRVTRRRRRRMLVDAASLATVAAVSLAGVFVLKTADSPSRPRGVVTATSDDATPPPTSGLSTVPDTTPSTEAPLTTPSTVPSTVPLVLPGRTGLMLPPDVLPPGWGPVSTFERGRELLSRSGAGDIETEITLGRYSSDRTRIVEVIGISVIHVDTGHTPESLIGGGDPIVVHGLPGVRSGTSIAWQEGDLIVTVGGLDAAADDLLAIAEGLEIKGVGQYDVGVIPDEFELIETLPGAVEDFGPEWTTSYASPIAIDSDKPDVILSVVAEPGESVESILAEGDRNAFVVDVAGTRAIVQPGAGARGAVTISWDLPGDARASLWYEPIASVDDEQTLIDEAVTLAGSARLATEVEWADLGAEAASNAASRAERPWIAEGLAERGLVLAGPSSQIPGIQLTPVLVAAGPTADEHTQSCEFLHTALVTCTPADPGSWDAALISTTVVDGDYVRVVVAPGVHTIALKYENAAWYAPPLALFDRPDSPGVAYFELNDELGPVCAQSQGENDSVIANAPIDGRSALTACAT